MEYQFTIDVATLDQLVAHLTSCGDQFVPPLGTRVDIKTYAGKLMSLATRFEAWNGNHLVGLVAAYENDLTSGLAFITSVSVESDHQRRNIAGQLLEVCILDARKRGFKSVGLEVSHENQPAKALYTKFGFGYMGDAPNGSAKFELPLTAGTPT